MQATPENPVVLTLDAPLEIARWRPLVAWLLAIPHFVVLYALGILFGILVVVSFFTILFTTRIPPAVFGLMTMVHRYQWRASSYALWLREPYPPFEFEPTPDDTGSDPAKVSLWYADRLSRFMPLVKWLLALPHYFALFALSVAGFFVLVYAFFAVLVTGRWPEGARSFLLAVTRWNLRVYAYVGLMTDVYPPFTLD
ncbi:MAG: DUF4389 domain-containing protein [Acidimicrobiales bacterium]